MAGILLVEHYRKLLCPFANTLVDGGHTVFIAYDDESAKSAIALHGKKIDIVVTDLLFNHGKTDPQDNIRIMPRDVLAAVRVDGRDRPVVGLTSRTEEYASRASLRKDAEGRCVVYVVKKTAIPLALRIIALIETWLSTSRKRRTNLLDDAVTDLMTRLDCVR